MMIFGCNALALQPFLLLMIDLLRRKPYARVASATRFVGFRHILVTLPPRNSEHLPCVQCGVRDIAQVCTFGHLESMPDAFFG